MSTETFYCPRCHRELANARERSGVAVCPYCGEPATRNQPGVLPVIGYRLPRPLKPVFRSLPQGLALNADLEVA